MTENDGRSCSSVSPNMIGQVKERPVHRLGAQRQRPAAAVSPTIPTLKEATGRGLSAAMVCPVRPGRHARCGSSTGCMTRVEAPIRGPLPEWGGSAISLNVRSEPAHRARADEFHQVHRPTIAPSPRALPREGRPQTGTMMQTDIARIGLPPSRGFWQRPAPRRPRDYPARPVRIVFSARRRGGGGRRVHPRRLADELQKGVAPAGSWWEEPPRRWPETSARAPLRRGRARRAIPSA